MVNNSNNYVDIDFRKIIEYINVNPAYLMNFSFKKLREVKDFEHMPKIIPEKFKILRKLVL